MSGTTTPLAYPYPTGTDRVMDGDNAIQALAEALDNDLAVGASQNLALGANLSGTITLYRRAGTAFLNYNLTATAALANGAVLTTIPAGLRPDAQTWFINGYNTSAAPFAVTPVHVLGATGVMSVQIAITSGHIFRGSTSWPCAM